MIAKISTVLGSTPEKIFPLLQKISILSEVARPVIFFKPVERLPKKWHIGNNYNFRLYLFNLFYIGDHSIILKKIDKKNKLIYSNEKGSLAKIWNHTITLKKSGNKTIYTDEVEIHSGLLTPFVWLFANFFYRHRQRKWRKIAEEL